MSLLSSFSSVKKIQMDWKKECLAEISQFIKNYLLSSDDYVLFGGRAVLAYYNENAQISEYLSSLATFDYDVIPINSPHFCEKLHRSLSRFFPSFRFEIYSEDGYQRMGTEMIPEKIEQIGVNLDGRSIEFLVDAHLRKEIPKVIVTIKGLRYPSIDWIIDELDIYIRLAKEKFSDYSEELTKIQKRSRRKEILERMITDFDLLDPEVQGIIVDECRKNGIELITGKNICPKVKMLYDVE